MLEGEHPNDNKRYVNVHDNSYPDYVLEVAESHSFPPPSLHALIELEIINCVDNRVYFQKARSGENNNSNVNEFNNFFDENILRIHEELNKSRLCILHQRLNRHQENLVKLDTPTGRLTNWCSSMYRHMFPTDGACSDHYTFTRATGLFYGQNNDNNNNSFTGTTSDDFIRIE